MATEAMIVTAQPEASEAGARVLMQGGNAVDAAMAAALVQGVVDPQMCGIAGFGSCQIYMPGTGAHTCIDFHGKTPLAATPEMWADRIEGEARDGFGFVLRDHVNDLGYQAVTTPGSLLAYSEAVRDFGFGQKTQVGLAGESGGLVSELNKWTKYSTSSVPMKTSHAQHTIAGLSFSRTGSQKR